MFGGYDPSYNPETAGVKKSGEAEEVSPQQQEMADKWATVMEDTPEATQQSQAEQTDDGQASGIQHFSEKSIDSTGFNPLSPEEQKAVAATEDTSRNDNDNLVARAVAEASGKGDSLDLNSVGAKLEQEGVSIQDEVASLEPDIAEDMREADNNGADGTASSTEVVSNLAVEAGAKALALKEEAGEKAMALSADIASKASAQAEGGDVALQTEGSLDSQIADFNENKSKTEELAQTAQSAANAAGIEPSKTITEAQTMITEAQEIIDTAQNDAKIATEAMADNKVDDETKEADATDTAEDSADQQDTDPALTDTPEGTPATDAPKETEKDDTDKKEDEDASATGTSQFTPDKYPELADMGIDARQNIFLKK